MIMRYIAVVLVLLTCGGGFIAAQGCSFRATNINFGNYTESTIRLTGTLTVSCPLGLLYAISLDAGNGSGATVFNRSMSSGSDRLQYGLYSNASHTANWGNTPGTGWVVGIGNGRDQFLTVYGLVPGNQFPASERLYNDNIVATLSSRDVRSLTVRFLRRTWLSEPTRARRSTSHPTSRWHAQTGQITAWAWMLEPLAERLRRTAA
jgi:spore coat protein U domain-containing protein, fimbrial subunit CupE1/2/3/6